MLAIILLTISLISLYAYYHWQRRHFYKIAAMVPGPTALPLIGNCLEIMWDPSDLLNAVTKLCDRYPDIVRTWFGPKLVYGIHKPEYMEIVMNRALEKQAFYRFAEPLVGQGIFTAAVELWKKQRHVIMPAFSHRILDGSLPLVTEEIQIMLEQMSKYHECGVFDIIAVVEKCTLDILCRTAMGIESHAQTSDSALYKWMDKLFDIMVSRVTIPWYYLDITWSLSRICKEGYKLVDKFHAFTDKVVKERRIAFESGVVLNKKNKAFLDILLEISNSSSDDDKLSDIDLRDQVNTFMVAGTDTIANTCCFLFVLIGMHPEVQEILHEEIVNNISNEKVLKYRELKKLTYTDCVIKETLRLFPPAALLLRNINEDIKLDDDITLAAGSSAFFNVIHVHRNKKYWPDPLKFDPTRFFNKEEVARRHPFSYVPFSGGPRNCPGTKYAMMVMKAIVALSVKQYRFCTLYKSVEDIKLRTHIMIRPINGFQVYVEQRH